MLFIDIEIPVHQYTSALSNIDAQTAVSGSIPNLMLFFNCLNRPVDADYSMIPLYQNHDTMFLFLVESYTYWLLESPLFGGTAVCKFKFT